MNLYRVKEVSDLFVDACVRDESGRLLMLSIYGRDGAILEFFASFSLPVEQGGLSEFTLLDQSGQPSTVYVVESGKLQKLSGRLPKANVFGNLVHTFLYDPRLHKPDKANRVAWGVYPTRDTHGRDVSRDAINQRLWGQIKDLSPVPLLDAWQDKVLSLPGEPIVKWMKHSLHPPLGMIDACRIELRPSFLDGISDAVRSGHIQLPGIDPTAQQPDAPTSFVQADLDSDEEEVAHVPEVPPLRLGQVVMTPGVEALISEHPRLIQQCLARHRMGDWGVGDKAENEAALRLGNRLLSAYQIDPSLPSKGYGDNTLWIITEWDRSVTTLLLPDEY